MYQLAVQDRTLQLAASRKTQNKIPPVGCGEVLKSCAVICSNFCSLFVELLSSQWSTKEWTATTGVPAKYPLFFELLGLNIEVQLGITDSHELRWSLDPLMLEDKLKSMILSTSRHQVPTYAWLPVAPRYGQQQHVETWFCICSRSLQARSSAHSTCITGKISAMFCIMIFREVPLFLL